MPSDWKPPKYTRPPVVPDSVKHAKFAPLCEGWATEGALDLPHLAAELGVSVRSLMRLGVGYDCDQECYTLPERNERGMVIGVNRRFYGGKKIAMFGSGRGLTFATDWHSGVGPILLPEGASDTAALLTMRLRAIGRPNNLGGVRHLTLLLWPFRSERIVVLGENDRKDAATLAALDPPHSPNCHACPRCWPGRYGSETTAKNLAKALRRPIGIAYPQKGWKDVRAWLQDIAPPDLRSCMAAGRKFVANLNVEIVRP